MEKKSVISSANAQKVIMQQLKKPVSRKELIEKCVKTQNLTPEEMKDKRSGEKLNKYKCEFGKAITKLLASGHIKQSEDEIISLSETEAKLTQQEVEENLDNDAKIEEIIIAVLTAGRLKKGDLLKNVIEKCKQNKFKIKDPKSDGGRVLSVLIKEEKVTKTDGEYMLPEKRTNEELIHTLSGPEFESHSVKMLRKWYKKYGYTETVGLVTGGRGDGGIDGVITGKDGLGYEHRIIMQMKHRENPKKLQSADELLQFLLTLSSDSKATKGLFITNAKFDTKTMNAVKKYKTKYLMFIDGNLWLKLAQECDYEIDRAEND